MWCIKLAPTWEAFAEEAERSLDGKLRVAKVSASAAAAASLLVERSRSREAMQLVEGYGLGSSESNAEGYDGYRQVILHQMMVQEC